MSIVDCHSHLSFLSLVDMEALVERAPDNIKWVMGGYQPSEWEQQIQLKKQFPDRIVTCFGLHPWYIKSDSFDMAVDMESLKLWVDQSSLIGEIGLDFFGDEELLKKDMQINLFEQQLQLSTGQAFAFHIVQAHGKALEILKDYSIKGYVHSFSGSIEVAEKYLQDNILLSFGPGILNENYKKAREALEKLPLEGILVESDSPSSPIDSSDPLDSLAKVYEEVARIKAVSVEELQQQVQQNFQKLMS